MPGIIHPSDWEKIVRTSSVFVNMEDEKPLNKIGLDFLLQQALLSSIQAFDTNRPIALGFSGGVDSSVLALELTELEAKFTAITLVGHEDHPDLIHANILAKVFEFNQMDFNHIVVIKNMKEKPIDMYSVLFETMKEQGFDQVICGDAIDEILGGYWQHQLPCGTHPDPDTDIEDVRREVFERFWEELYTRHLSMLDYYAKQFGVSVALPYLAAFDRLVRIPMSQRANSTGRKIILRQLAAHLGVPDEIINRPKFGLVNAWNAESRK